MSINNSRRIFFKIAGLSISIFAVYKLKYFESPIRILSHYFDKPLQDLSAHDFYFLSQDLLGETEPSLSQDLSNRIWTQLNSEPKFKEKLWLLLSDHKKAKKNSGSFELTEEIAEIHKIAIKKVLRFWYTGVVEDQNHNQERFFYEEALMHSYFYQLRPPPGNCAGTFGYWSNPPKNS
jgi:hypothetical protein